MLSLSIDVAVVLNRNNRESGYDDQLGALERLWV